MWLGTQAQKAWVQIAAATLSANSLRQTVHTRRASVHQAAKLVAAFWLVAGVTADLAESNGSLPPGLWLTSPAGRLPKTGTSFRTLRSVIEYGLPLPLLYAEKPSSIKDRGQTDRATTPTRALDFRRWRWPRPHHAVRPAALARSWWRHRGNLLLRLAKRCSRYSCSTYTFVALTFDVNFQSPATNYDDDTQHAKNQGQKTFGSKYRVDGRTDEHNPSQVTFLR